MSTPIHIPPRIEKIKIRNFRVLRDVTFEGLTPLTVLLGPNGSGKSTFSMFSLFCRIAFPKACAAPSANAAMG